MISQVIFAGTVKTIEMTEKTMQPIYLQMGKSTILHFVTDKPKKVVVGNSNYFGIEFTGNDVTIQPLGVVETNLFVYGDDHRYGFLLRVNAGGGYDDLINIRWKNTYTYTWNKAPEKEKKVEVKSTKSNGITLIKKLEVKELTVISHTQLKVQILDMILVNNQNKEVALNSNFFELTRSNKIIPAKETVFLKEKLSKGEESKVRIFVEKQISPFSFWLKFEGMKKRTIITKEML